MSDESTQLLRTSRRLVIMRHAKSDWPDGVDDHERPLLERGRRESALAGAWMRTHDLMPDHILCSSAVRTQETCAGVRNTLGEDAPVPDIRDELYAAFPQRMLTVINHVPEYADTVLLIAHMPGVQELVMALASAQSDEEAYADATSRFPTSSFAILELTKPWAELDGHDARLVRFVVPRE